MRIAVLSDVHGNLAALDAVLDDIARQGADATLGLGDFLSGPFDPLGVANRLIESGMPVVRGNHDRLLIAPPPQEHDWPVDAWLRGQMSSDHADWLRGMSETLVFDGAVFMCHGTPTSDDTFWMDRPTDEHGWLFNSREHIEALAAGINHPVLLCGHTHVARTIRLEDGRLLVNPGAVGLPFLLGSPDARYAIIEQRGGEWSAALHAIPYPRDLAIGQALANGYPGFARALESGWASIHDL